MANHGAATKFASVNLNKSYGQPQNHHHSSPSHNSASYAAASGRSRAAGGHGGGFGGGGGGGMVVLSRPRSSQKAGPKLSVPPPLNLPSLRKEHEKFDSLGLGGGPTGVGGGASASGTRPSSSGMGWTKPVASVSALQENKPLGEGIVVDGFDSNRGNNNNSSSSAYLPPSARSAVVGGGSVVSNNYSASNVMAHGSSGEKVAVLRGEDFPSLRATLSTGPSQKVKENVNLRNKQSVSDGFSNEQKDDVNSKLYSSHGGGGGGGGGGNGMGEDGGDVRGFRGGGGGLRVADNDRKQEEYFLGPLPIVRLKPRSDWADDERDTSHGLTDRSRENRDHGFLNSKNEAYWDRSFDFPRASAMPHKPALNFDKWGHRDNEAGKVSSSEVPKLNSVRASSREGREGNSWRNSSLAAQGVGNDRNGVGIRPSSMNREVGMDNKYVPSTFQDNLHDDFRKREMGHGQKGRQSWNNTMDSYGNRGLERSGRDSFAANEQYHRYSSSPASKPLSSVGVKGIPADDPLLNFNREKRTLPKSEKSFLDDPFMKDFGASGFDFSASLVGMVKKKKEVPKQMDFHDPARESFEAEIEKVQRMQELERQRNIEEHEKALELARREEEERMRQIREQEERQRRLEEEAREAAWRAEQEQLEVLRKAEEQKVAREEEKRRIFLEEERRKQAAKQKLLELEERMARRDADAAKVGSDSFAVADEKMSGMGGEKDASRRTDAGDWDDSERVVERIMTSAPSNSSSLNKPLETGARPQFSRDSSSSFVDRGKMGNSWRRDVYENDRNSVFYSHSHGNGPNSPIGGKPLSRKEYDGGAGFMTSRASNKGGIVDAHIDDYANAKGQRWNELGNGDHLSRITEVDSDFSDNLERLSDGWTPGRTRGNMFSSYPEHGYPNSESGGSYAIGRSRYSVRQPRVLPPPSLTSVPKTYRDVNAHLNPAAVQENNMPTGYDDAYQRSYGRPEVVGALPDNQENEDRKVESTTVQRCDSQSSLSVSSPPSSPTHLSHDDLEDSGVSPGILVSVEDKSGPLSGQQNDSVVTSARGASENIVSSTCAFSSGDDEEWTTDNHEQFQEQEEYDEDENYQEEEEVHEGDDNAALNQGFKNMNLEEKDLPHMMDNFVLGFDEGIQVGMPNDEFEKSLKGEEASFMAQASSGTLEEHARFGNACSDGMPLQPVKSKAGLDDPNVFQDSEKSMHDLVIQSTVAQTSVVSEGLDNAEASNSDLSSHHNKLTSVTGAPYSPSDLSNMSNAANAQSQVDLPVKLQFGLFTGPSLIPSPVPAIQIGSIQMPLHLHPQVGGPHSHMHPSQPPLFQFGQLRYPSPISQGMMPVGPQSMSFIQSNIPSEFSFNHKPGGPMPLQTGPDAIDNFVKSDIRSPAVDNQPNNLNHVNLSQGSLPNEGNENMAGSSRSQTRIPHDGKSSARTSKGFQRDEQVQQAFVAKNGGTSCNARDYKGQAHGRDVSTHSASTEKGFKESKAHYPASARRGKRYAFVVKGSGSNSSGPVPRSNYPETSGFQSRPRRNVQRTEFRVRVSGEKSLSSGLVSSDQFFSDSTTNMNGTGSGMYAKSGPRKVFPNRLGKQAVESTCSSSATDLSRADSGGRADKVDGKELPKISGQGHLKRNICSGKEVDAPLQSGIIRVFEQPGIEAPSDEDDFIEVRSKRQMLNDRREQREKEIKAKSRVAKVPRKSHSASHGAKSKDIGSRGTLPIIEAANSRHSDFVVPDGNAMQKSEILSGSVSQPLAPIGTPPLKIDVQSDLRLDTSRSLQMSLPAVSGGGKNPGAGVIFDSKNKARNNVQTSLGNVQTNQQVMALTQRQLDEAMKPQQFDSQPSVDLTVNFSKPSLPTSSILTREKPFSSVVSPINSLLAGEKIQFGAVTSPTVLPPSSRAQSHGIGPGSSVSNMQISHNPAGSDHGCSLFYDKEKHNNGSNDNLEDCEAEAEAEAEAAASAVAVAAIGSDEIAVNGLGSSISVSEARTYGAVDIDGIAAGVANNQQSSSKAISEEPLCVSLPADLSVETPPISFWPPLPALQNSSQMLSHFPGGPPPHFPMYEMNPMMGGHVFSYGPHDESASATQQQQSQKSSMQASGPINSWQQCHSGVDSFYGPAAGFTGPFITPPRGIPGVQAPPPHMVVYNHFAPVGQYGQVGLSFMGATYIPSGKQSDWKHNPTTSATGVSEGDMNNMNMAQSQRNPINITAPIQHLAPGSPLVPMASPLAMFDISPFQSSPEMSVQARWPHVPNSPLSSMPLSMPQQEGAHASQYNHGPCGDQPMSVDRFPTSQTSAPSDGDRNFPTGAGVNFNRLPDELGLVDPSNSAAKQSALGSVIKTPSVSIIADAAKVDVQSGNGSKSNSQNASAAFKSQPLEKNNTSQQYDQSSGYTNYQRPVSQKNNSGAEWSGRRMGLQGRNQTLGADKNFSTSKVKQIYVAKQTNAGASGS